MRPGPVIATLFVVLGLVTVANSVQAMSGGRGTGWLDWAVVVLGVSMLVLGARSLTVHRRRRRAARRADRRDRVR